MKKLIVLLITAAALCIFGISASAIGTETVIPTKTLNKILDEYRSAIKSGSSYVDLSDYGLTYSSEVYAELWLYFTRADGDTGSISFGKYSESYVTSSIDADSAAGKIKGVKLEYDKHYRKDDGSCDIELVKKDQALVTERFNRARSLASRNMTDVEKALLYYDFVISAANYPITYDTDQFGDKIYSKDTYTVTGLLRDGYAICTAYAKLYAILLNEAGIDAVTVDSDTISHEWTMVKIDGKWYHCDPTWDDLFANQSSTIFNEPNNDNWDIGAVNHKFFLKSDEEFRELDHPDWDISYTVNPDYLEKAPASGPSGSFDDMFFSSSNETYHCVSAMNYINGFWYFADLNSNSIVSTTIDGDPEFVPLPDNQKPKYTFGYQNQLYVCTDDYIYRFDPLINSFEVIIEAPKSDGRKTVFSEMNINFDEMTVITASFVSDNDNSDAEFEVTGYPMDEVVIMKAIAVETDEEDTETISRDENEETERLPQITRPGGPSNQNSMNDEDKKLIEEAQNAGKRISSLIYLGIAAFFLIFGIVAIILAIKANKKR